MNSTDDKKFREFVARNSQKELVKPEGEWREIMAQVERLKAKNKLISFSKWILGPAMAVCLSAVVVFTVFKRNATDDDLGDFINEAQVLSYDDSDADTLDQEDEIDQGEAAYEEQYLSLVD